MGAGRGEKKHIPLNKDAECKNTALDVTCGLVAYLFSKHTCGTSPRSKATWAGLTGYKQKLPNSWPLRIYKLESEAKETTDTYKVRHTVRRDIRQHRHKNGGWGGGDNSGDEGSFKKEVTSAVARRMSGT